MTDRENVVGDHSGGRALHLAHTAEAGIRMALGLAVERHGSIHCGRVGSTQRYRKRGESVIRLLRAGPR